MKKYILKNMDCASCATKIEEELSKMDGVKSCSVNFANASLHIDTDNIDSVKKRIKEIESEVELIESIKDSVEKVKPISITNELIDYKKLIRIVSVVLILIFGMVFENFLHATTFKWAEYLVFGTAYLISGWDVLKAAFKNILTGSIFSENTLMTIATIGAFAIDAMPEAVTVMLFYVVGELFQDIAVNRSRKSIKSLLELKPEFANKKNNNEIIKVSPESILVDDLIIVKAGEKIPLDGQIIGGNSFVDTSALTGESVPRKVEENDIVLAGMINQSGLLTIKVTKLFSESSISKILELVENSSSKKAETEKFITTFAKYYTPVVVFGALLIAVIPPLFISGAAFSDWIYRALVVLVISCPCALVISIPLGYFGGIGGASRKGILIKGSNYLDVLTKVKTVVFDKTGTLTKGEFRVTEVVTENGFLKEDIIKYAAYAEANSSHPIAKSVINAFNDKIQVNEIKNVTEISGQGISANIFGSDVIVGNDKILHNNNIIHSKCNVEGTVIHVAVKNIYAGYIIISDILKDEAVETINELKSRKIKTVMLTGDNKNSAESFANKLGINEFYSELLPEQKVEHIEQLLGNIQNGKVAFVGDGINDAPVIARADVGIAMGALGSDAAIDTADIVFMADSPMLIVKSIDVAKRTRTIVWQNIMFAFGIKLLFIILGIFGIATMWEAVFGDMGVAVLAIINSMRVMK